MPLSRPAGDVNTITVGDNTNLQDGVVVHVAKTALGSPAPTIIGHNVTVGEPAVAPSAPLLGYGASASTCSAYIIRSIATVVLSWRTSPPPLWCVLRSMPLSGLDAGGSRFLHSKERISERSSGWQSFKPHSSSASSDDGN